ncbi:MAG TPA: multicopper oxidase domain-containing protein [Terriglobales bacterium]|nr:multicopper oxidase domain-containing protein [Terriglobales bacterium]
MSHENENTQSAITRLAAVVMVAVAVLLTGMARAAVPGITASAGGSSTFNLVASQGYISQPDGALIYSWGYGCATSSASFVPYATGAFCPSMQIPGPTLVVTQGVSFTVTLTNNLPTGVGNTSIVFQGATVTATGGTAGLLAQEATPAAAGVVTYTVTYANAGTHAYYSGTQSDLQIEMGLYGAVVVKPSATPTTGANCSAIGSDIAQQLGGGKDDFRLAVAAYNHPEACYDREYLTQWMELDAHIHKQAQTQVQAIATCTTAPCPTALDVKTEPYHPSYFLINGRSMPDNMDPSYAPNYPNQPYNANPHMHPGDFVLVRVIGQGHWQHPFHEHGNHVRILARDGNLILSQNDPLASATNPARLGGRMEFNTDTTPGQAFDGIFYWSGKGLGWDIYGHTNAYADATQPCNPDANGYYTKNSGATAASPNYYEWCADHNHPLEVNPVGHVGGGGPATQFDPLVATNGLWYNGTPYLGPDAVGRNRGPTPLPPSASSMNPFIESGIAFMWHSHNEREITTNDLFPGGMLQMMLVDPPTFWIDETL